jgi:hypothetical protein
VGFEVEAEDRLAFDIRYALRDMPVVRSREERMAGPRRDDAAGKIVERLKLANWVIREGQPRRDWPGKRRQQ